MLLSLYPYGLLYNLPPFQVAEIGDDCGMLAAERETDEVLRAADTHFTSHGL